MRCEGIILSPFGAVLTCMGRWCPTEVRRKMSLDLRLYQEVGRSILHPGYDLSISASPGIRAFYRETPLAVLIHQARPCA
jgi:hypothetical protein